MSEYEYAYVLHEITSITFDGSRVKRRIVAVSTKPFRDNRPLSDERVELYAQSSSKKRWQILKEGPRGQEIIIPARIPWPERADKIRSMAGEVLFKDPGNLLRSLQHIDILGAAKLIHVFCILFSDAQLHLAPVGEDCG